MEMDRDAFTKITEALKYQADKLIDLQFDLFALAAAIKNQVSTDQASFEQDFRAVRLVLGKGRPLPESSERLIRLLLVRDATSARRPIVGHNRRTWFRRTLPEARKIIDPHCSPAQ